MKQKAFVKYTKLGKIIPGSLIIRPNGIPPSDGLYKEIQSDLCCDFDPRIVLKLSASYSNKPYDGNDLASVNGLVTIIEGVLPQDIGKVGVDFNYYPLLNGSRFVSSNIGNHIGCYLDDTVVLTGPLAYKYKFDPLAISGYANITP